MELSQIRQRLKQEDYKILFIKNAYNPNTYQKSALYLIFAISNITNTFTPYKTARHRRRDLSMLLAGLLFTALGLLSIPLSLFTGNIVQNVVAAVAKIFVGVSLIVTSPLALIRISWRSYLSYGTKWQNFQDRKSIKALVHKADLIIKAPAGKNSTLNMRLVLDQLHLKAAMKIGPGHPGKEEMFAMYERVYIATMPEVPQTNANFFIPKERDGISAITRNEIQKINKHLDYFRPN